MSDRSMTCPFCDAPAVEGTRVASYRRGDRVIKIEAKHWECSQECKGSNGREPYRFEDPRLLRENDQTARRVWLERFSEPMPTAGRPGRKPKEKREHRVPVLLTETEIKRLDELRGEQSRSEFLRDRLGTTPTRAPGFPLYEQPLAEKGRRRSHVRDGT